MAKEAPDVEIISKPAMLWEPTNAGKVFEDQILVNPDIDLVFAHSGAPDRADRVDHGSQGHEAGRHDDAGRRAACRWHSTTSARAGSRPRSSSRPSPRSTASPCSCPKILKGEKLKPGTYKVLGLDAVLTDEEWGPNLKIPGATIIKANVDETAVLGQHEDPHRPGGARAVGGPAWPAPVEAAGGAGGRRPSRSSCWTIWSGGSWRASSWSARSRSSISSRSGSSSTSCQHATFVGLLAVGLSFCIIAGHMDLSIESVMAFAAMLAAWLTAVARLAARHRSSTPG